MRKSARKSNRKLMVFASALATTFAVAAWAQNTTETIKPDAKPSTPAPTSEVKTAPKGPAIPVDLGPIHNGFKLGRNIYSGSCPYGDAGFKVLAEKGIKTIITVDGARPDAATAQKYGMRYVHIPVTYSGITRAQALSVARAVRDLPGPVFIHCHHGKHRGPTAAVLAIMVSEGWTTEQAQELLTQARTSPRYKGLWANARDWKQATKEELDNADNSFPAAARVGNTATAMVDIDARWEHLGEVRDADWSTPASHPDIDPPHEALLLREHFTEVLRLPETQKYPADYREKMTQAEAAARVLEAALREKNHGKAQDAYKNISTACGSCHAVYRNVQPVTE